MRYNDCMRMITQEIINDLLRLKPDGTLYHREQKDLEYKESFNLAGLAEYLRDVAAFANNSGGYIIFGVTNSPRKLKGLIGSGLKQFKKIDEEKISGYINEHFAPYVDWEMNILKVKGKSFGILYAHKARTKPVICKKGNDRQTLKSGEIYYRYAGRTEIIQYSELVSIIEGRVSENNELWVSKVQKIGQSGPANVGILDTATGLMETGNATLLIDSDLVKEINFIKEGSFKERKGAKALKLVGTVKSTNSVEVARVVKKHLIDEYPHSYKKVEAIIRKRIPDINVNSIPKIIKENNIKDDPRYSAYNYRTKDQENDYKINGKDPTKGGVPSIYNDAAVEFLTKILTQKKK